MMALLSFALESADSSVAWKVFAAIAAVVSFTFIINDYLVSKVGDSLRYAGLFTLLVLSGMSTIKFLDVRRPLKWI